MKPSVLLLLGMRAWHSDIQESPEVHYEPSYPQWYGVRSTAMPTGQVKRTSLGRPRKPAEDAKSVRPLPGEWRSELGLTSGTDTTRPGP